MSKPMLEIDTISKNIKTFGSIAISHRVKIGKIDRKTGKFVDLVKKYQSTRSNAGIMGAVSYVIRETIDQIVLSSTQSNFNEKSIPNMVQLSYEHIENFKKLGNFVKSWKDSKKYKNNLYIYDENGIPYKISEQFKDLNAKFDVNTFFNKNFLAVRPDIIMETINEFNYPGVVLICGTGIIGSCTLTEAEALFSVVTDLLENLYSNSLNLLKIVGLEI